jgi:hypothetical protein
MKIELKDNCKDVTKEFKFNLAHRKLSNSLSLYDKDALNHITYITNIEVWSYNCMVDGHNIEFKIQVPEEINGYTLIYLN